MLVVLLLHVIQLVLLIVILVYVIRLSNKESFCNCTGAQYNGLTFLDNPKSPICPQTTSSPYREGGCLQYDPQKVSVDYPYEKKRITFV